MNQFLFSPTKQFVYPSGKILAGGKIYVFIKHTNTLATLFNDEGVEIANPVVLDSNGRATVLANEDYDYKLDVYTSDDELLFTAASYMTDQYERDIAIISTDGSVDIATSVSGYTDVWDLSVYESIKGATSGKFDTSAFENFYTNDYGPTISHINQDINYISGTVNTIVSSIPDLNNYYTKSETSGAGQLAEAFNTVSGGLSSLSSYVNDCCSSLPETYVPYSATTITTASTAQLVDADTVATMITSATSAIDTFSGVTTDSTLTGDGKNDPLGVASIQSLTSDESISITSGNNEVILGVNSSWFDNAVNSAYTGTTFTGVDIDSTLTGDGSTSSLGVNMIMLTGMLDNAKNEAVASAQSGLIRDIDFMLQNVTIYPDTMSGYNADGTVWLKYHWGCDGSTEASGDELENYFDGSIRTNYISMAPSALDVFDAVRTNSANWSQGTTYSSVSGTVLISGNDLEISQPAIRTGVPWILDGWSHSYDDSTAFNAGFQKQYNTYRLEHIMYSRQYPNSAHPGFSAELRQLDENYNILSSTMLYGIFDFTFTPVSNCDMIWLYCSGTSAECQRGISDYYIDGNNTKWVENLAWENDTPTRNEFANLYENIAVNSGSWSNPGTSLTGDAQGAVDEVYANSGNWEDCYNYVSSNSGSFTGNYISAGGFNQSITGGKYGLTFYNKAAGATAVDYPAIYLSGQFGSAYYKENELKLNRDGHQIAFNIGGGGPSITAAATTTRNSRIWLYNSNNSGYYCQSGINYTNSTANETVDIPSIQRWNSYSAKQDALTYTFVEI